MLRTIIKKRRVRSLAAVVAATSLALSGCSSSSSEDDDTYVVGFPALLSGPAAFAGVPVTEGAKLAAKEINESGYLGDGVKVDLRIDDVKGDPAQSIALYKQYAADGASGVLCCGISAEAGALAPMVEATKVPSIITVAILADIAKPPYVYRPIVLPSESGGMYDQLVDAVVPAEDVKTAVIVTSADNDAMVGDAVVWEAALKRNGVEVLKTIKTNTADTNFTQQATEIAALDPDVVVQSMIGTPSALLARALRERDFTNRILSSYGVDSAALWKASAGGLAGTLFPVPFHAGFSDNEVATKFTAAYLKEYGKDPDMYGAQGYTAMWLLAQGMKDAGSKDPAKVAEALAEITSQETVYGTLAFAGGQASLDAPGNHLEWTADGTLAAWGD